MREYFSADDWDTLLFAPCLANYATSMIDNLTVEPAEQRAFVELVVSRAIGGDDPLVKEICETIMIDVVDTLQRLQAASGDHAPATVMREAVQIAEVADRMFAPGFAAAYRQFLVDVLERTAAASGLTEGSEIARTQREILDEIEHMLAAVGPGG